MSEPWEPSSSQPGEMYTPEGQIKAWGALARGLKNDDPRHRRYRRQMQRTGLLIAGAAIAVVVLVAIVTALF
jgi:hypothetical protein